MSDLTELVKGRHPQTQQIARWFEYEHLTHPEDRQVSASFARLVGELVKRIPSDSPELVVAFRKLLEGKDAAVRASIAARTPPAPPDL